MSALVPGWVDGIAAAVKSSEKERREALGMKPHKSFRIDHARLMDSASRGGRKGGSAPKKPRTK